MRPDITEYNLKLPTLQPNHRFVPTEAVNMLQDVLSDNIYGYYVIGLHKQDGPVKRLVSAQGETLLKYIEGMHISDYRDYYITKNPSKNGQWHAEDIASLQNIAIDIDCHQDGITAAELRPTLKDITRHLTESLFLDQIVPYPNYIVYTGRGLHLWWLFDSNAPTNCYLGKYNKVKDTWIELIMQSLKQYMGDYVLSVDRSASMSNMGYMRLPGSINTKTHSVVDVQRFHQGRYNLHREYDNLRNSGENTKHIGYVKPHSSTNLGALFAWRIDFITRLRAYRNAPVGAETRNDMNFQVYCAARKLYGPDKAYDVLRQFNAGFKRPLTDRELKNVICTAQRKADHNDGYKIRNATLFTKLGVSEEEVRILGANVGRRRKKNEARDERRRERRAVRNAQILEAYQRIGTFQGVAKVTGYDPRTIKKVIMLHSEIVASEEQAAENRGTAGNQGQEVTTKITLEKDIQYKFLADNSGSNFVADFCHLSIMRICKNGRVRMYLFTAPRRKLFTQTVPVLFHGHAKDNLSQSQKPKSGSILGIRIGNDLYFVWPHHFPISLDKLSLRRYTITIILPRRCLRGGVVP